MVFTILPFTFVLLAAVWIVFGALAIVFSILPLAFVPLAAVFIVFGALAMS